MNNVIVIENQVINVDRIQGGTKVNETYIIKMVDGSFMFLETEEEIEEFLEKIQEYAMLSLYSLRAQVTK